MKVLVLGGAGYIGSVLCPYFEAQGDQVIIYDNFLYEKKPNSIKAHKIIRADVRDVNTLIPAIDEVDAVVNLAAISNDPATDLQPKLSWDVNYKVNETIAHLCHATNKRIVYASSCSVYGFSDTEEFNEESRLGPVTLYARTKMLSEQFYLHTNVDAISLRFATVYGYSPKPRFDLVVNTMVGSAYFNKQIVVNGGSQWRAIVHVKDVARAVYTAVHSKNHTYRVYNVGSNEQNYQISQLGKLIHSELPEVKLTINESSIDGRSYRVNFNRIKEDLNFETKYTVKDAIVEIMDAFKTKKITNLSDDAYFRVKYLKKHTNNGELKENIFSKYYSKILSLI